MFFVEATTKNISRNRPPETRVRLVGPAKTKEVLEWSPGRGIVMILKVSCLMVI
jgi:hypothetical protein